MGVLLPVVAAVVALSASAHETGYRVGPGDVVDIKIYGETEFSGFFRVGTDGTIDYPFIRKLKAQGKTREELATELTSLLKDGYLKDPQVSVDVKDYRSQTVFVLGAVNRPGTYALEEDTKILDLLSRAGGISGAGGKRILLIRPSDKTAKSATDAATVLTSVDTKPIVIDYFRMVHEGDFTQNLVVQDGDILNIPRANEIFVLGNVGRPGPIKFEDNMTVLQAVTLAGGPTPTASTKSTYILRQGPNGEEKLGVRLDRILENKEKNILIKTDDVIVVPESFF